MAERVRTVFPSSNLTLRQAGASRKPMRSTAVPSLTSQQAVTGKNADDAVAVLH
jgi:hypothetical protein